MRPVDSVRLAEILPTNEYHTPTLAQKLLHRFLCAPNNYLEARANSVLHQGIDSQQQIVFKV